MKTDEEINACGYKLIAACFLLGAVMLMLAATASTARAVGYCQAVGVHHTGQPWEWAGHGRLCEITLAGQPVRQR